MKLLIITYFFPPLNSIASLRLYSFAKYLTEFGLDVTVFTAPKKVNNMDYSSNFFVNNGYKLIELPIPKVFKIISINKLVNKFAVITGAYYKNRFPDDSDRWLKPAFNYLKNFYFDIVISSYGPYVCHNIALLLKKKFNVRYWIADFRDLFTDSPIYTGIPIFYPIEKKMEQEFFNNSDLITVVSQAMKKVLSNKTNNPIEVIYNGFFEENFSFINVNDFSFNSIKNSSIINIFHNKNIFKIVYTGTFYKSQKITNLLLAINQLKNEGIINANNFRLIIAGSYDIISEIKKYNLGDIYIYLGLVSFSDSLKIQYLSDILLLPLEEIDISKYNNTKNINKYKGILTGKLFEYLGLNLYKLTPIWVINKTIDSEKIEILNKSGVATIFFDDINKLKSYLVKAIKSKEEFLREYNVNTEFIKQFNRKDQAKKLYNIILDLVKNIYFNII
jgi:hypothetical protein